MIHHGDCLDVMAGMDPESVDAIVTDPPYDLLSTGGRNGSRRVDSPNSPAGRRSVGFMGKAWDGTGVAFDPETWRLALRVAKPGAYLLAFGGTRTVHRLTCAIEDAGWIIRDMLVWAYASGFPKSKASLKPAWEPIVMARKPLRGTVAANVLAHGTGALNIDGCRMPTDDPVNPLGPKARTTASWREAEGRSDIGPRPDWARPPGGRWPANVILTDPIFDGDVPGVVGGGETSGISEGVRGRNQFGLINDDGWQPSGAGEPVGYGDSGTYSRFFLIPKAARSDREPVLGGLGTTEVRAESAFSIVCAKCNRQKVNVPGAACQCDEPEWVRKSRTARLNGHPTVKPTDLMRHLVRLVTPPGGTVLDPFLGSGTTALACEAEGFAWVGIEREAEYVAIAEARLNGTQRGLGLETA